MDNLPVAAASVGLPGEQSALQAAPSSSVVTAGVFVVVRTPAAAYAGVGAVQD